MNMWAFWEKCWTTCFIYRPETKHVKIITPMVDVCAKLAMKTPKEWQGYLNIHLICFIIDVQYRNNSIDSCKLRSMHGVQNHTFQLHQCTTNFTGPKAKPLARGPVPILITVIYESDVLIVKTIALWKTCQYYMCISIDFLITSLTVFKQPIKFNRTDSK